MLTITLDQDGPIWLVDTGDRSEHGTAICRMSIDPNRNGSFRISFLSEQRKEDGKVRFKFIRDVLLSVEQRRKYLSDVSIVDG